MTETPDNFDEIDHQFEEQLQATLALDPLERLQRLTDLTDELESETNRS